MNVVELWQGAVRDFPDRVLVAGGNPLTYRDVDRLAATGAERLGELGVTDGTKVALFVPTDENFLISFLAVLKAGGVVVYVDAHLSRREMSRVLEFVSPDLAIVGGKTVAETDFLGSEISTIQISDGRLVAGATAAAAPGDDAEVEGVAVLACRVRAGAPNVVALRHDTLVAATRGLERSLDWEEEEVFANPLPNWRLSGTVVLTLLPIALGASIVFLQRATPETILRSIEREGVTRFGGAPRVYSLLNRYPFGDRYEVGGCRSWISCVGLLPASVADEFSRKFGARIDSVYGAEEAAGVVASTLGTEPEGSEGESREGVGCALPGVTIEIRNELGETLPADKAGEVWVQGASVAVRYYGDVAATRRASDDGWFDTRDLGHLTESGLLVVTGRRDESILIEGKSVSPLEVETVLRRDHQLSDVAVLGRQDPRGVPEILAFVVPSDTGAVDATALQSLCVQELAPHKVPKSVLLVDRIPRLSNGRVRQSELLGSLDQSLDRVRPA